jgi:hypothetical protein
LPEFRNTGAAVSINAKKNPETANITTIAQATNGSCICDLNFLNTSTVSAATMVPQSRIEPSNADHIVATLNGNGVREEPWVATNATLESLVNSAICINITAPSAAKSDSEARVLSLTTSFKEERRAPRTPLHIPAKLHRNPHASAALPRLTGIRELIPLMVQSWSG